MLGSIAIELARDLILPEVIKALRHSDVPVADADVKQVADAVADKVAPVIVNEANAEPWYQSRVTIGALVSIGTGIAALFGFTFAPEDVNEITVISIAAGTVVGGLITLYGRWKAKKPLGR